MRAHLHLLARWARLLLACLAVGSTVSPAQVASAAQAVTIREGGPGKPPAAVLAPRHQAQAHARFLPRPASRTVVRAVSPEVTPSCALPLFLLHRALLR